WAGWLRSTRPSCHCWAFFRCGQNVQGEKFDNTSVAKAQGVAAQGNDGSEIGKAKLRLGPSSRETLGKSLGFPIQCWSRSFRLRPKESGDHGQNTNEKRSGRSWANSSSEAWLSSARRGIAERARQPRLGFPQAVRAECEGDQSHSQRRNEENR